MLSRYVVTHNSNDRLRIIISSTKLVETVVDLRDFHDAASICDQSYCVEHNNDNCIEART